MIRLEQGGPLGWLRIDRAAKKNAMTQAMWEAVPPLVAEAIDGGALVILLASAAPGVFSAGADIAEFGAMAGDPAWRRANRLAIRAAQKALAGASIPSIAVVDGDCVGGGCGMAMACDLRVASPASRFGITPAKLGLVYPLHDVALLVGLVGPARLVA
jgi:enoyl-CoA hydratase/carnithine racemase